MGERQRHSSLLITPVTSSSRPNSGPTQKGIEWFQNPTPRIHVTLSYNSHPRSPVRAQDTQICASKRPQSIPPWPCERISCKRSPSTTHIFAQRKFLCRGARLRNCAEHKPYLRRVKGSQIYTKSRGNSRLGVGKGGVKIISPRWNSGCLTEIGHYCLRLQKAVSFSDVKSMQKGILTHWNTNSVKICEMASNPLVVPSVPMA